MRHYKKGRKLGTSASHTKAMKKSLVAALFENDRIKTIEPRAKEIRGDVDRVITWAKKGDVHSRRLAIAKVGDQELVREIFEKVAQGMFKDRPGGYTRIMKIGPRSGDKAPMVIMELVTEPVKAKKKAADTTTKKEKAAPKKEAAEPEEKAADEAVAEETATAEVESLDAAEEAKEAVDAAQEAAEVADEAADAPAEAAEAAEEAAVEAKAEADTEAVEATDAAEAATEAVEDAEAAQAADEEKAE